MSFGLKHSEIDLITKTIQKYDSIVKAAVFGSRVLNTHKQGSDIDIVLYGDNITDEELLKLTDELNETSATPYFYDILIYNKIQNTNLIEHIDKFGQILFSKN